MKAKQVKTQEEAKQVPDNKLAKEVQEVFEETPRGIHNSLTEEINRYEGLHYWQDEDE